MALNRFFASLVFVLLILATQSAAAQTFADYHLGAWNVQTDVRLSEARSEPALARGGDFVFAVGGGIMTPSGGSTFRSPTRTVDCFTIESARLRRVNQSGPCALLPESRQQASAVAQSGYLYVIGGRTSSGVPSTDVIRAPINADGTLGAWTAAGTLPSPSLYTDAVVVSGYLVVIGVGGNTRGDGTVVVRAPILPGGTLGAWQTLQSIPRQLYTRAVVVVGGRVYVIGQSSVSAVIQPDGTLAPWQPIASPQNRQTSAGAFGGYMYAFGNDCQADPPPVPCESRFAERAVIRADGSLGAWERTSGWQARSFFTEPAIDMKGLLIDRHAYFFGGFNENDDDTYQFVFDTIGRSAIGAPRIRGVRPELVPEVGGPTVELQGVNFVASSRVFVRDTEVPPTGFSTGSIRFVVPAGPVGMTSIRVVNPDGESDRAPLQYIETLARSPQSFRALATGLNVRLQWTPPEGGPNPTAYVLEIGGTSGATDVGQFDVGRLTEITATFSPGRYFARVRGRTSTGLGQASNEVSFIAGSGTAPPSAPRQLSATVNLSNVVLRWQAPDGEQPVVGYVLEVGFASGRTDVNANVGNVLQFSATAASGTYYVRVRAYNEAGLGPPSAELIVVVGQPFPPPGAPSTLRSTLGPNRTVTLTWTASSGIVSHYVIEVGTSAGSSNLGSFPVGSTTVIVANVPPGSYFIRVRAVNAAGPSAPSNEILLVMQ